MEQFVGRRVRVVYQWEGVEYSYTGTVTKMEGDFLSLEEAFSSFDGTTKDRKVDRRMPNILRVEPV